MREEVRGRWYVSISYCVCAGNIGKGKAQIGQGVSALFIWHGISRVVLSKGRRSNRNRKQKPLLPSRSHLSLLFFLLKPNEPLKPSLILTQTMSHIRLLLSTISRLLERNTTPYSLAHEPVLLAVGVHQPVSPRAEVPTEEWEDLCRECGGWEWVDGEVSRDEVNGAKNEFGGM